MRQRSTRVRDIALSETAWPRATRSRSPTTSATSSRCRSCSTCLRRRDLSRRHADFVIVDPGLDLRRLARRATPMSTRPANDRAARALSSSSALAVLSSCGSSSSCASCSGCLTPMRLRRADRRRDRGSRRHRGAPSPGGRRAARTGACRIASPARATARRSPASSMTRCAGAPRRAWLMGDDTPRAIAARHAASCERGLGRRCDRRRCAPASASRRSR